MGKLNKLLNFHQPGSCKKGSRKPGRIPYTAENMKHVIWCLDNGVFISLTPNWSTANSWNVDVKLKGVINTDPIDYTDEQALVKMYKYYEYYYNKYNENKI